MTINIRVFKNNIPINGVIVSYERRKPFLFCATNITNSFGYACFETEKGEVTLYISGKNISFYKEICLEDGLEFRFWKFKILKLLDFLLKYVKVVLLICFLSISTLGGIKWQLTF